MSSRLPRRVALAAPLLLLLAGCGGAGASADTRQAVAASFPLAWVTEQVAGPTWTVTNLTRPGVEPHDLELGIAETAAVEEAALVVFQHGFQPSVDDAVDNVATGTLVDAAEVVDLLPVDHAHDEHDQAPEVEHDHGDHDPHFWLDPLRVADLGDAVAAALADASPDDAAGYTERAADLRRRLERLDTAYVDGLADCERDTVVVSHEAFGYLARYGLHFEGIAGLTPDAEPGAAVLAQLQQLIRDEGITTVFSERLASPAMAQALAADAGVRTAVLDPLEGPADGDDGDDYVALMLANLAALQEANGC